MDANLIAAVTLGLAGAGHCLGMCGGIAVAFRAHPKNLFGMSLSYHTGRLLSYTLLGALLGSATGAIKLAAWTVALRLLAGFLLIAMGLHTLELWMGIRRLEALGGRVWHVVSPLASRFMPPKQLHHSALLGMLWGLMPCGLIYSALAWSAVAGGDSTSSGALMLAFGLGTLPAMLGTTLLGVRIQQFLSRRWVRNTLGCLLILTGIWSTWLTLSHFNHLTGVSHHEHTMQ